MPLPSKQSGQKMGFENSDDWLCQVCSSPNARKRYNGVVCNACRVFFGRHSDESSYRCEGNNNCDVTYKKLRMNCQACRLKKCIEANMRINDKYAVEPHMVVATCTPAKRITQMYGEIMNNGFKIIGSLKSCQDVSGWIEQLVHFDSQLLAREGDSPSSATANTALSLTDVLMFPGSCIDRTTRAFDILGKSQSSFSYKLNETVLRIIVAAVENMTLVEEFHFLPIMDRIKLVQENAIVLSVCVLTHVKICKGWDSSSTAQYFERFRLTGEGRAYWKSIITVWSSYGSVKLDEKMKEAQPTDKEMLLLRVMCLFRVDHTDDGYSVIIKARLKLASLLAEHIRASNPTFSKEQVQRRLCQIMELENFLKEVAVAFNNIYLTMTAQGFNGFSNPLSHDIFIRKF